MCRQPYWRNRKTCTSAALRCWTNLGSWRPRIASMISKWNLHFISLLFRLSCRFLFVTAPFVSIEKTFEIVWALTGWLSIKWCNREQAERNTPHYTDGQLLPVYPRSPDWLVRKLYDAKSLPWKVSSCFVSFDSFFFPPSQPTNKDKKTNKIKPSLSSFQLVSRMKVDIRHNMPSRKSTCTIASFLLCLLRLLLTSRRRKPGKSNNFP